MCDGCLLLGYVVAMSKHYSHIKALGGLRFLRYFSREVGKQSTHVSSEISLIRNVGILAHIDAGKTTTTERMLYYSGTIHSMGEVHRGNTVTDYMVEERNRGITITSAAVTFYWDEHKFNLIDTPGHIDFTIEVERTLNVLDGAIVILDGSAGVEAQTLTVWRQADRYGIPRIIFVNKMDRRDASLNLSVESLKYKLDLNPLLIQLPVYDEEKKFSGIIDLVSLNILSWSEKDQGKTYTRTPVCQQRHGKLWERATESRNSLIDQLTTLDDELADLVIQHDSMESISSEPLLKSLRNVSSSQKGVPILCGSAYKNMGVQPLMNAVINFLPSPEKRNTHLAKAFQDNLCARVFKIVHNDQKKTLTFARIYSGKISKNQKIYNIQQKLTENTGKLMVVYADETTEVNEVTNGNIAAVSGLKSTVTGDFLTSSHAIAERARKALSLRNKVTVNESFGIDTIVPDPVFFCSIEPPSQAYQQQLETALVELQKEDPSLRVSVNEETGQTVLAGMGELHLDVIKNRIITHYRIPVELGPLQIAYKETITNRIQDSHTIQHKLGNKLQNVTITLSLTPDAERKGNSQDLLIFDRSPDSAANIDSIPSKYIQPLKQGAVSGLAHGPRLNCPVINIHIILHWIEIGKGTSETFVSAAMTQCIKKMLTESVTILLEPVMKVEVVTTNEFMSVILADLSRRRPLTQEIEDRGLNRVVVSCVPLSELLGYATDLRTITSGTATFSMEFFSYKPMTSAEEAKAIESVTGFSTAAFT
ncbi:ribosome-releasing factor 2, mitochondrial isoform X1 [Schistocerca americana]|uniref:ribosome-releasing factor 2, mitochondrial isoform X1 n=2 Tax=Schistocerca americana TaxID=7009 RepID=UPI001F500C2A|nr:ribosome-releasing factor 2, mitochondrial isoform X1 [Schistocerca americana]XP_046992202.1 ribosome-releasing factor 2, mitochondrial isoform X1 [Schistocerca americana]